MPVVSRQTAACPLRSVGLPIPEDVVQRCGILITNFVSSPKSLLRFLAIFCSRGSAPSIAGRSRRECCRDQQSSASSSACTRTPETICAARPNTKTLLPSRPQVLRCLYPTTGQNGSESKRAFSDSGQKRACRQQSRLQGISALGRAHQNLGYSCCFTALRTPTIGCR